MPNGKDTMAQAVYLAQLQACKNQCKCNTCRILRKASDQMAADFLNPTGSNPSTVKQALDMTGTPGDATIFVDEED